MLLLPGAHLKALGGLRPHIENHAKARLLMQINVFSLPSLGVMVYSNVFIVYSHMPVLVM